METNEVVRKLEHQGIISQGVLETITKTSSRKQRNEILFGCLEQTGTKEALIRFCSIVMEVEGNPKMKALGTDMKNRLETCQCKCTYMHGY